MRVTAIVSLFFAAFVLTSCAHQGSAQKCQCAMEGKAVASSAIYWCDCGAECKCKTVSTKPGKCGCGKEMAGGHVVFVEGNTALVCGCGPTCACSIDPNDHSKCTCGQPVKRINLEGTGLYFCNCGGSCGCATISDQPGTCKCGMPLHQAQ